MEKTAIFRHNHRFNDHLDSASFVVYLMLNAEPEATFAEGKQLLFSVTVLNQLNPRLDATLTLTITGPGGYSFYDFQPITVSENAVGEYSFNWVAPNGKGTYIVEQV